jgi:hypothetical protein
MPEPWIWGLWILILVTCSMLILIMQTSCIQDVIHFHHTTNLVPPCDIDHWHTSVRVMSFTALIMESLDIIFSSHKFNCLISRSYEDFCRLSLQ